ncbi:MAG: hypothetical protein M1816_001782 [Peltula sp. TS41687]|nr:MAG: hypothetical protein M1816_001782 [Peltula sp. TS41687]
MSSEMHSTSASALFPYGDPFQQSFVLLLPDGTPFNMTVKDLESFNLYNVRISINYGSQLGASLILLVIMLLLTKPDKRGSPIFIFNALALAFNFIRTLLQALYFTSGFNVPYAFFAGDFSRVPTTDYANSVAANAFTLMLLLVLEASLVLQVHVVCATMRDVHRKALTVFCAIVALVAVAFRFALVVENSIAIMKAMNFISWKWLASATNITTTISICLFCAIFIGKLALAMWERKKMGLRQYGPMRIIFIMGCQTMFVPAIFAVLQYFTEVPELGTNVLTLVSIFLPLSSMWAATLVNGRKQEARNPHSQRKLFATRSSHSTGPFSERKDSKETITLANSPHLEVGGTHALDLVGSGKYDLEAQHGKD